MTIAKNEAVQLPLNKFKEKWLSEKEENFIYSERMKQGAELQDLMICLCDSCMAARGVKCCELYGDCSKKMSVQLMALGFRRMESTVTEAFDILTRRLKENVTGDNVDFFVK